MEYLSDPVTLLALGVGGYVVFTAVTGFCKKPAIREAPKKGRNALGTPFNVDQSSQLILRT